MGVKSHDEVLVDTIHTLQRMADEAAAQEDLLRRMAELLLEARADLASASVVEPILTPDWLQDQEEKLGVRRVVAVHLWESALGAWYALRQAWMRGTSQARVSFHLVQRAWDAYRAQRRN